MAGINHRTLLKRLCPPHRLSTWMLLCFLFPGTLKIYIKTFIADFSSCLIVVSILWDLGYIFWIWFGARHHRCRWVVFVGFIFCCSFSSWTLLKREHWGYSALAPLGVSVPVMPFMLEFSFFPFTWIIPLFLLLFLQMTPLVSKKMDQFLGESWGCLFIITIHAVKIEPC